MPDGLKAGSPTYWTRFGQGPKPALAIHCSLAHSGSWGALARHLSGALTLTAFDMPGHGRSGEWDGHGEIQKRTAEIAADLLDGPAHVIGHSFGATVALRLAVLRPELVRSLVLIEPVFFAVALADHPEMREGFAAQMAGSVLWRSIGINWILRTSFTPGIRRISAISSLNVSKSISGQKVLS